MTNNISIAKMLEAAAIVLAAEKVTPKEIEVLKYIAKMMRIKKTNEVMVDTSKTRTLKTLEKKGLVSAPDSIPLYEKVEWGKVVQRFKQCWLTEKGIEFLRANGVDVVSPVVNPQVAPKETP